MAWCRRHSRRTVSIPQHRDCRY